MKARTAKDIMNENVWVIGPNASIEYLNEFLIEHGISGAPVTSEDGKLLGVVSMSDIVRHSNTLERKTPSDDPHDYYLRGLEHQYAKQEIETFRVSTEQLTTVRDIMTPMIFDVSEDTSVKQVADTMIRGRIHRVFVTRDKKLVGVVTTVDMLKLIRDF